MKAKQRTAHGSTSLMAVFFVSLFASLAVSFTALTETNIQMSQNHRDAAEAQAAAESGLEFGQYLINSFITDVVPSSFYGTISEDDSTVVYKELVSYCQYLLDGSNIIDGKILAEASTFNTAGQTGTTFLISDVKMIDGRDADFSVEFTHYDDDPFTLIMTSTGSKTGMNRRVSLSYSMIKDTRLLDSSIVSRSRIIITGDSTIDRGIYSTWDYPDFASPIELEAGSTVNGDLNTTVSEVDFPMEALDGDYNEINFDQPDIIDDLGILGFEASDYNTSMYLDMTSSLSPSDSSGQIDEYFPHLPGNYNLPADGDSSKILRKVYEGVTLTDTQVSAGNDTLFRNCVFEGVLYIGSDGVGVATNNVRFEDCTFNGPIVTAVPNNFTSETWKKNVLYFTGNSVFNNTTDMQNLAILAPNFNVNIGNTKTLVDGESALNGLVVGGVVDVRGSFDLNGTIVSMYEPDPEDGFRNATNIGYSDENSESGYLPVPDGESTGTIDVSPNPDQTIPMGMSSRFLIVLNNDSYVEY